VLASAALGAAILLGVWAVVLARSAPQPPAPPSLVIALAPGPAAPPPASNKPLQAFARPFDRSDKRPRVAVILSNETDRGAAAMAAAVKLPGAITLALTPYTPNLPDWAARAHQAGHEILLGLPMEPIDLSIYDPGPLALLSSAEPAANRERLDKLLGRANGYVGALPLGGGRLLADADKLRPILAELHRRGLLFVEVSGPAGNAVAATAGDLPRVKVDQVVEAETREALERRLAELEGAARRGGAVVGLVGANPAAIDKVGAWAAGLEARGIALAPVTAMLPQ
jgi:polysaccharide deacetylase 2 family uncharacterized protein YibQ